MKLSILMHGTALISAVALASGAWADGMPRRGVQDPGPPPFSWTGAYVGINVGWAGAEGDGTNSVPCSAACPYFAPANAAAINRNGGFSPSDGAFIGGGQIGYNVQAGALVYGVEADFNSLRTKSAVTNDIRYATAAAN